MNRRLQTYLHRIENAIYSLPQEEAERLAGTLADFAEFQQDRYCRRDDALRAEMTAREVRAMWRNGYRGDD